MGKSRTKTVTRTERIQRQLQQQLYEQTLQQALANHRQYHKSFTWLVDAIDTGQISRPELINASEEILFDLFAQLPKKSEKRLLFKRLLLHVYRQNAHSLLEKESFLTGLFNITSHAAYLIRDIAHWKRDGYNADKQFSSLLRHCFAKYEVPLFMDHAWLPGGRFIECQWFIDIGNGISVRKLSYLPFVMTKHMAHLFLQAPDYCTVNEAFRYAQVVALGGDEWLAWYVNRSYLGQNGFRDDDFWSTVTRFLAEAPMLDARHIDQIIDYISYQRQLQPNFSMKGRTPNALLRQVEEWQVQTNRRNNRGGAAVWKTSGLREAIYETPDMDGKWYRMNELLSSNELHDEGEAMSHCVYSYVWSCTKKQCTIFSLRLEDVQTLESERLVTVEVDLRNERVVQAKARFNDQPEPAHLDLIRKWAASEGLTVAKWL